MTVRSFQILKISWNVLILFMKNCTWIIPRTLDWGKKTIRVYRLWIPIPTDISDDSVSLLHIHNLRGSIFVCRTWRCSYRVAMIQEITHLPISKWRQSGWERGRKRRGRDIIHFWINWVAHRAREKQGRNCVSVTWVQYQKLLGTAPGVLYDALRFAKFSSMTLPHSYLKT